MEFCRFLYSVKFVVRSLGRFLGRENLRDAEQNYTDASKPVARHFNLPNHSHHNMTICGLPYTTGTQKVAKISNKNSFFQLGTLSP